MSSVTECFSELYDEFLYCHHPPIILYISFTFIAEHHPVLWQHDFPEHKSIDYKQDAIRYACIDHGNEITYSIHVSTAEEAA